MAKSNSRTTRDGALQSSDISDEKVSQVGKAVGQIMQLRQSLEQNMAAAQTEEERQALAEQVESAALRMLGDNGLTVAEYNEVITAAQADPDLEERVLIAVKSV